MTLGPDQGSAGDDLLGQDAIQGLAQRLAAAPQLEARVTADPPGLELVGGIGGQEQIVILCCEDEAGREGVVVDTGDPNDDEADSRAGKRARRLRERLRSAQDSRSTRAKYSRNRRRARSTQDLSAPDWFSGADSTSSTMRR